MSKAIAVEEAFNGVGRSRSRVIEDSTDFTQFHPLDVREENWIRATVIYRVLRTAHLFSKREGGGRRRRKDFETRLCRDFTTLLPRAGRRLKVQARLPVENVSFLETIKSGVGYRERR